jgi:predicted metal-binding protein
MTPLFEVPRNVKQISPAKTGAQIAADLGLLQRRIIDLGAAAADIIASSQVLFSPDVHARASADISYPSFNWPLALPRDDMRDAIGAYQKGILFSLFSEKPMPDYGGGPIPDEDHRKLYERLYALVTDIESSSFYMGYHLALGLAAGNCRAVFCRGEDRCVAMVKGRGCIHPYKGRPSMEAVGIDARALTHTISMTGEDDNRLLAGLVMIV